MSLTGKDVWDAIVRLGLRERPIRPRTNRSCVNADNIARLLNEVLTKRQSWLPNSVEDRRCGAAMGSQCSPRVRAAALQIPQCDGVYGGRNRCRN